ncbi:glycoside hydrolase family protein [Anseongella ginsenosidimutans]|uniref:glycoside hydrolase family protein n=1 Tax=Anseongella ginsenosidimutans TaxID=496056 RepID=UPI0011C9CEEB|nr:glycoside hydrolase family protein [Anseongella ginsenosidimutans]QEC52689.1 hypothetical protein FRZ59_10285 [Anseongella ginsenosidimutans]
MAFLAFFVLLPGARSQFTERERSAEWEGLAFGGRFLDRFLPIPPVGELTADTWGADAVRPRYVDNGVEDGEWSYWGGNALSGTDGKYHLFVCRWREDSPKGHMQWPQSLVVHAVAGNPQGPYQVKETIGPGHNPEVFRLKDGRYVIYVIDGRYVADDLNGPWTYGKFEFDPRDRPIIEGLSNLSFAQREDGSFIMVCRGGGIWFSEDGLSPYYQVSQKSVYPPVEGRFEDPVLWRTGSQYHLIVNDWYGRIAYYLRSPNGVDWKADAGEAYLPGITRYTDGVREDWFKYERLKVLQDSLGRPMQAFFAVIDTLKKEDKPSDRHSSKNLTIPLVTGRQIEILNKNRIAPGTQEIRLRIKAEQGFDPQRNIDLRSLRFGSPEEVDFGRGSKIKSFKSEGKDLILTFHGKNNALSDSSFMAKLLGRTSGGTLLFGYARLHGIDYQPPILSARAPRITVSGSKKVSVAVEVQNFGQTISEKSSVEVRILREGARLGSFKMHLEELEPFQKEVLETAGNLDLEKGENYNAEIVITPGPAELPFSALKSGQSNQPH